LCYGWEVINHPPYGHHTTHSDFPLSVLVKKHLAFKRQWQEARVTWLQALDTDFLYVTLQTLVLQWDKCLNVNGNHMEVRCVPSASCVPCICQCQDEVLTIRVIVTFFFSYSFVDFPILFFWFDHEPHFHLSVWTPVTYCNNYKSIQNLKLRI
jgi:hypothetical protein